MLPDRQVHRETASSGLSTAMPKNDRIWFPCPLSPMTRPRSRPGSGRRQGFFVASPQTTTRFPGVSSASRCRCASPEAEVIIYSPAVAEIARHRLFPRGVVQQRSVDRAHRPRDNAPEHLTLFLATSSANWARRPAASSTACCVISAVAGTRRGVCSRCWAPMPARTSSPPSNARFASAHPARRSNASWRPRPSPKRSWKPWRTTIAAACNRCWTSPCRRAVPPNTSSSGRMPTTMAKRTQRRNPASTTNASADSETSPAGPA